MLMRVFRQDTYRAGLDFSPKGASIKKEPPV
jgi:hypothetical protein